MLCAYQPTLPHLELPQWHNLGWSQIRKWPLEELSSATDRALTRLACLIALKQVVLVVGWENVLPRHDPFLLIANHSSRREALFLPAVLMLARGGRTIRFLADWNFRLIPGAGSLYNRSGAITLTRKDARPRVLNLLKPLFEPETPPLVTAKRHLLRGGSVGIFPEGTVNRDADQLLRGRRAAARLSLETQVPVVPVGIRFDQRIGSTGQIDSSSGMSIHIGKALDPATLQGTPVTPRSVTDWNAQLMAEVGRLCGKRSGGEHRTCGRIADFGPTARPVSSHSG